MTITASRRSSLFLDPAIPHSKTAVESSFGSVSYGELDAIISNTSTLMRELGLVPGDRVLIVLPDSIAFIAVFLACEVNGWIAVPVNPFFGLPELSKLRQDSNAAVVVMSSRVHGHADSIGPQIGATLLLSLDDASDWSIRHRVPRTDFAPVTSFRHSTDAFILYTSGSTGIPRGIVHRYTHLRAVAESVGVSVMKISGDDRILSMAKMHFAFGLGLSLATALSVGATILTYPDRFAPLEVLQVIKRFQPSIFAGVPFVYKQLLAAARGGIDDPFVSLRLLLSAGEPLPNELFKEFFEITSQSIVEGYGCTESLHHVLSNSAGNPISGSCGKPVTDCEIELRGSDGSIVLPGEQGRLYVRTPRASIGVWSREGLKPICDHQGWIDTGDYFTQASAGDYFFLGRKDEFVKVRGMRIPLRVLSAALLQSAMIRELALVPLETSKQQLLIACVAPAPECHPSLLKIKDLLRAASFSPALVDRLLLVDALPRTGTGKLDRRELRARILNEGFPDE